MIFIDTNYFLRFFLKDVSDQHEKAKELFRKGAKGDVALFTSTIVFFEIYWVATSFYKKNKEDIAILLGNMLKMDFIVLDERTILVRSVDLFASTRFDLEDAYNLVHAVTHGAREFKTFDRTLEKLFLSRRT